MIDSPASLLREMQAFQDAGDGELEPVFGDRVRALDPHELLTYLSRTFDNSRLAVWLRLLAFAWQDVPYSTWQRVLEDLADDRRHLYDFLWFASKSLAVDIHRLGVAHPNVEAELRGETFRDGGPHPISPTLREQMEELVRLRVGLESPRARGRADAGSATRQPRPPRHPRVDGGRRSGARLPGRSHLRAAAAEHGAGREMRPPHSDAAVGGVVRNREMLFAAHVDVRIR